MTVSLYLKVRKYISCFQIQGRSRKMKNKIINIFLVLILLCGIGVLSYPFISNILQDRKQDQILTEYNEEMSSLYAEFQKICCILWWGWNTAGGSSWCSRRGGQQPARDYHHFRAEQNGSDRGRSASDRERYFMEESRLCWNRADRSIDYFWIYP